MSIFIASVNTGDCKGKYITFNGSLNSGTGEEISISVPHGDMTPELRGLASKVCLNDSYLVKDEGKLFYHLGQLDTIEVQVGDIKYYTSGDLGEVHKGVEITQIPTKLGLIFECIKHCIRDNY